MDRVLRGYLAELVGTFFLTFFCGAIVCLLHSDSGSRPAVGLVGVAVAQGCAVAVLLWATTLVSEGCLNPAVTLMLWVIKKFDSGRTVLLIVVQCLGAVLGGLLLFVLFDQDVLRKASAGTPRLIAFRDIEGRATLGAWSAGSAVEACLTFLLCLAIFSSVLDPRRAKLGLAVVGLATTAAVLVGFNLTGAALNPARWLGTAVWQGNVPGIQNPFDDHVVYWMGPIVGGLMAGVFYTSVIGLPENGKGEQGASAP